MVQPETLEAVAVAVWQVREILVDLETMRVEPKEVDPEVLVGQASISVQHGTELFLVAVAGVGLALVARRVIQGAILCMVAVAGLDIRALERVNNPYLVVTVVVTVVTVKFQAAGVAKTATAHPV